MATIVTLEEEGIMVVADMVGLEGVDGLLTGTMLMGAKYIWAWMLVVTILRWPKLPGFLS